MDRYRGVTLTAKPILSAPPEGKRLRRKLQKVGTQQRSYPAKNVEIGLEKAVHFQDAKLQVADTGLAKPQFKSQPAPDLSDPKWATYTRKSGIVGNAAKRPSSQPKRSMSAQIQMPEKPSSPIIPEFAHLALRDGSRESLGTSSDTSGNSSKSSSTMRRYAKTPIFRVGQLEGHAQREDPNEDGEDESLQTIADQYRALIQSRCSILNGSPTPSVYEDALEEIRAKTPFFPAEVTKERLFELTRPQSPVPSSPKSDGTLVGFEEDAIYFKPVSFTPELRAPSVAPDNFSLQICFDLLTRDLSSALPGAEPDGAATETQALQIWTMIEAYEKLRDKMMDMNLNTDQKSPLEDMFDMWLRALYNVHDKITGNDGQVSESIYAD